MRAVLSAVFTVLLASCAGGAGPSSSAPVAPPVASSKAPAASSAAPVPSPTPSSAPDVTAPAPLADATILTDAQLAEDAALTPKAAALVGAFANVGPVLLADGRVVFMSTRDGVPALYVGDAKSPAAAPRKLPGPDERIRGFTLLPDERTVLFLSDVKSDEFFSIFRVDIDGTGLRNLTPDAKLRRDLPAVAAKRNGTFAFSAHTTTDRIARVLVAETDGAPAREIAQDPTGGFVAAMSPDGSRVLFLRFASESEQVLFVIDVARGRPKRVYPAEGTANLAGATFAADGAGIYVSVQHAGAPPELLLLDAGTFAERARYTERAVPTGAIEGLNVSPAGDRIAATIDAGNRSEIRLLDAKTLAAGPKVKLGPGSASRPRFSADGKRFGLTSFSPEGPADVVAIDARTGDVTPLRADVRPGLGGSVKIAARIETLKAFDGLALPVNLYLPRGGAAKKLPTLVLIHGGPSGSAYLRWSATIAFFIERGFAVVEPNIRGSTGFGVDFEKADDREKRGDALKDVESVNTWARAQPWCDGTKLVIGGISYGGYMTLLALTRQPTLWAAGIDGSGMSDLRTMEKNETQTLRAYDDTEFGALGKDDVLLAEWSPLKDVASIVAPVFVYQGVHDPVTPRSEADQIVRALRDGKVPVEYMLLENEGHGLVRRESTTAYLARTYRFLRENLKLAAPSPK